MRYALAYSALVSVASAHGVVTMVQGGNGVMMPGLSIIDGTPRDCSSPACGSEADTSIIRKRDMKTMPLGKTQGGGPVNAATNVGAFMSGMNKQKSATGGSGGKKKSAADKKAAEQRNQERKRQLSQLLGGGGGGAAAKGNKNNRAAESMVSDTAGSGASQGLPTTDSSGMVTMTYRQINQDGAGPLTADIDGTSGGTDNAAFQKAYVAQDVPGIGIGGLSLASNTDFPVKVKMPAGMTCEGTVGDAKNVCIVRVRNGAAAGPFGGSAAFTQSSTARKRAIAYRLKKRFEIRAEQQNSATAATAADPEPDFEDDSPVVIEDDSPTFVDDE